MNYKEGTVGYLIEQLNKIKDKNKKVYWVETQYDDYACYGDGTITTFHNIDGFCEDAVKDGIVLSGERLDYDKEPESVYNLSEVGTVLLTRDKVLVDDFKWNEIYDYVTPSYFEYLYDDKNDYRLNYPVKVVTGHYDFKDIVVEMSPEQCYNYLRENALVYMEEETGNL